MREGDSIKLTQGGYILDCLKRFGMTECNSVSTPMDVNNKLSRVVTSLKKNESTFPYRELVGCITYLAMTTRPNICFAASCLGQFNNCATEVYWKAAKRVLRHLKGRRAHLWT